MTMLIGKADPEVIGPRTGKRTHGVIMSIIREGAEHGWSEERLVEELKLVMPLDQRRAKAVVNYRRGLKAQGMAPNLVQMYAKTYAQKLKEDRARVVARTESTRMERDRRRLFRPGYKRRWVAKKDACPLCKALHGMEMDDEGGYGPIVGPPAHPNCRCREVITRKKLDT